MTQRSWTASPCHGGVDSVANPFAYPPCGRRAYRPQRGASGERPARTAVTRRSDRAFE